jgi:hypothetical protein
MLKNRIFLSLLASAALVACSDSTDDTTTTPGTDAGDAGDGSGGDTDVPDTDGSGEPDTETDGTGGPEPDVQPDVPVVPETETACGDGEDEDEDGATDCDDSDCETNIVCQEEPGCGECPLAAMCAWRGEGDDPALGSAGVSGKQARFDGSDRQARGALMKALTFGPVDTTDVATIIARSDAVAAEVVAGLLADRLVTAHGTTLHLG